MSGKRHELLLCALRRAGKALTCGQTLDQATGLALGEGWDTAQLEELTTKSASRLLQNMVNSEIITQGTQAFDDDTRRMVPTYDAKSSYDPKAPVPKPPEPIRRGSAKESNYAELDATQLMAVLDSHDDVIECVGRFFADLTSVRDKVRRRLMAAGLGTR